MWILAFEFSSDQRSVAVVEGLAPFRVTGRAAVAGVKRTPGLALVDAAMREAGVVKSDVSRLAVGLGPGSYTGIRIGLALVQGWQLATGVPVVGVRSVEAMVEAEWRRGHRGGLHVVVDAQRGDLYHAGYELGADGWREVETLAIRPAASLAADSQRWITPEAKPLLPWAATVYPDAGTLGAMAAVAEPASTASLLEPVYLRETAFVKAPPGRVVPGLDAG